MAQNDAAFTGSIPQLYDEHMGALLFAPYAEDMAKRLSGMTEGALLETAAGTGIVTQALAAKLAPAVRITATDLNQPMLDHAAKKPGVRRVAFKQADAQALPFPDDSFDAVVCQFGVMFLPDKVQGFLEARRVLRPGGRLIFNVWDKIETVPVIEVAVAALRRRHPKHPSWFMERVPFAYHDEKKIRADLDAAGFTDCVIETVALAGHGPDARSPAPRHVPGITARRGNRDARAEWPSGGDRGCRGHDHRALRQGAVRSAVASACGGGAEDKPKDVA